MKGNSIVGEREEPGQQRLCDEILVEAARVNLTGRRCTGSGYFLMHGVNATVDPFATDQASSLGPLLYLLHVTR